MASVNWVSGSSSPNSLDVHISWSVSDVNADHHFELAVLDEASGDWWFYGGNIPYTATSYDITVQYYKSYQARFFIYDLYGMQVDYSFSFTTATSAPNVYGVSTNVTANSLDVGVSWSASDMRASDTFKVLLLDSASGTWYVHAGPLSYTARSATIHPSAYKTYTGQVAIYDSGGSKISYQSFNFTTYQLTTRPAKFYWIDNTHPVSSGMYIDEVLTSSNWLRMTNNLNDLRMYKYGLTPYSFTYPSGNISASIVSEALAAIRVLSPPTTPPSNPSTGGDIYASIFSGIQNSLNSIP